MLVFIIYPLILNIFFFSFYTSFCTFIRLILKRKSKEKEKLSVNFSPISVPRIKFLGKKYKI